MPNEDFDLDGFLGDFTFSETASAVIREEFAKAENTQKLKDSVSRQSDYDRKMNAGKKDLEAQSEAIKAKEATLQGLITENLDYKSKAEQAVHAAQVRARTAELKGMKAALDAGYGSLDEIEVDEDAPRKPKADVPDSAALKKEFTDELQRIAKGSLEMTLALDEVKGEYLELTGKHLKSTRPLLEAWAKDLQKNQNTTLMDTASKLYEFDTIRTDKSKKDIDAEVDRRVKEAEAKLRQEMSESGGLPSPRNGTPVPAIFRKSEKRDPERGIKAALAHIQGEAA